MSRQPPKGWKPKAGDKVMVVSHFGFESGPYPVLKITPKGGVRVRFNDVATELFTQSLGNGIYYAPYGTGHPSPGHLAPVVAP